MPDRAFQEALDSFAERDPGIQSFEQLGQDCQTLARAHGQHAALFALVGVAARQLAERFEDRPVSVIEATAERDGLTEAGRAVARSLDGSEAEKLAALNALTRDLILAG